MKPLNVKIPNNLITLVESSDFKRKDDIYTIVDLIYRRQSTFRRKSFNKFLFVNISTSYFKKFISKNEFIKDVIDFLNDNNVLDVNETYSSGRFPRSYRLNTNYLGKTSYITIKDKTINKKYNIYREELRKGKVKNNQKTKTKYLKEFNLDYDAAIEATYQHSAKAINKLCISKGAYLTVEDIISFLKGNGSFETTMIVNKYLIKEKDFYKNLNILNLHQHLVDNIKNSFLYFKRNATNGRLDSNLSNLPTYLRKFIITDKEFFHIDISNSQPYFLYCTIKDEIKTSNEEINKYGKLVTEGQIYEFYASKWNAKYDRKINRNQAKKYFFCILFSKTSSYQKQKDIFREEFPNIMGWIDMKNSISNNVVSIEMTNKESFTILDVIKPKLIKLGINSYTIHDSFLCYKEEVDTIVNIINETLLEMYNTKPKLHINNLLEEEEVEEEIDEIDDTYDYGDINEFLN